jgi:hypothetical protein
VLENRVAHADILDVWIDHPWTTAVAAGLVSLVSLRETTLLRVSASTPTKAARHTEQRPRPYRRRAGSAGLGAGSRR